MFCLGTHTGSGHNAGASGAPAGQGAGTGAGHTVGGGGETAWLGRHKRNAPDTRTHNSSKRGRRGSSYCSQASSNCTTVYALRTYSHCVPLIGVRYTFTHAAAPAGQTHWETVEEEERELV